MQLAQKQVDWRQPGAQSSGASKRSISLSHAAHATRDVQRTFEIDERTKAVDDRYSPRQTVINDC